MRIIAFIIPSLLLLLWCTTALSASSSWVLATPEAKITKFSFLQDTTKSEVEPLASDSLNPNNSASDSLNLVSAVGDSTVTLADSLTLAALNADSVIKKPFIVTPWKAWPSNNEIMVTSDSLWRWRYRSDLSDELATLANAMPHRTAIQLRSDATIIGAESPQQQQLFWHSMPMQDPLTDHPMLEHIPTSQLQRLRLGRNADALHLDFTNRNFHVREPWSQLHFEESDGEYQNLAFMLTRNFGQRWNTEVRYRQIRDGNLYRVSDSEGGQLFLQNTFQWTQKLRLIHQTYRSDIKVDEPFGYQIQQTDLFAFNPFTANPNQQSRQNRFFSVHRFMLESRADSLSKPDFQLQYFRKKNERSINAGVDTTDYSIITHGLSTQKTVNVLDKLALRLNGFSEFHQINGQISARSLPKQVLNAQFNANLNLRLNASLSLFANSTIRYRNEPVSEMTLAQLGGVRVSKTKGSIELQVFRREVLPSVVQLLSLQSTSAQPMEDIGMELKATKRRGNWEFNIQGSYLNRSQQLLIPFLYGTTAASATAVENQVVSQASYQIKWNRNSLYSSHRLNFLQLERPQLIDRRLFSAWELGWKNYIFKKAAYLDLSAELRNDLMPFYGLAYDPIYQIWQPQNFATIPAFRSVLDLRVSARIRSMMILVRWENLLDSMAQLGYFETIGYPAPARRLVFGIRALFKN